MTDENNFGVRRPCTCAKEAAESLKAVQPIKEGILKEVQCKGCGKTFLTNFETEYCYDCRRNVRR